MRASEVIGRSRSLLPEGPVRVEAGRPRRRFRGNGTIPAGPSKCAGDRVANLVPAMPLPIQGDQVQLQQVILNSIVNAMDAMSAMPSSERTIKITTARDGNFACLTVSDVGPGIPVDQLKQVFEPFFTTKPQGMGMGLSIARTIVEAHGGQLGREPSRTRRDISHQRAACRIAAMINAQDDVRARTSCIGAPTSKIELRRASAGPAARSGAGSGR